MSKKSGFLFGALVGAAAALFFAPKKGSELREDAGKFYDDFKENPQEALNNWRDTAVDFSVDRFNEIKEKFDSGEISADKAREYLLLKRDFIKEKVDSGELSKEKVLDFFNATRDAIMDKVTTAKSEREELFDDGDDADDDETEFMEEKLAEADKPVHTDAAGEPSVDPDEEITE